MSNNDSEAYYTCSASLLLLILSHDALKHSLETEKQSCIQYYSVSLTLLFKNCLLRMDLKVRNVNLSFDLNLVWLNKLSVTLNITP